MTFLLPLYTCDKSQMSDLSLHRPSLSRPANTLYRHKLTTTLETAIQGSSSSTDDDEVLGRLDARMLEYEHGEVGWDVFTLEYKVDPPVDVIIDGRSMELYSKLFSHLWRIKRVEYTLTESWKRMMNESRYHRRITGESMACRFIRQYQLPNQMTDQIL
jgi:gamma-tubulin complex component 3